MGRVGDFAGEYYATINGATYSSTQASAYNELYRRGTPFVCKESNPSFWSSDHWRTGANESFGWLYAGQTYYFFADFSQQLDIWGNWQEAYRAPYLIGKNEYESIPGSNSHLAYCTIDCFPADCKLTLNPGDGTFNNKNQGESVLYTKSYGSTLEITEADLPTKPNYIIKCWKGSDGSVYDPTFTYSFIQDATLTAEWTRKPITITLHCKDENQTDVKKIISAYAGDEIDLADIGSSYTYWSNYTIKFTCKAKQYLDDNNTIISTNNSVMYSYTDDKVVDIDYKKKFGITYWGYTQGQKDVTSGKVIYYENVELFAYYEYINKYSMGAINFPTINSTSQNRTVQCALTISYLSDTNASILYTKSIPNSKIFSNDTYWYLDDGTRIDTLQSTIKKLIDGYNGKLEYVAYAKFIDPYISIAMAQPSAIKDINNKVKVGAAKFNTPKNLLQANAETTSFIKVTDFEYCAESIDIMYNLGHTLGTLKLTSVCPNNGQLTGYTWRWNNNELIEDESSDSFMKMLKVCNIVEPLTELIFIQNYSTPAETTMINIPEFSLVDGVKYVGVIADKTNSSDDEQILKNSITYDVDTSTELTEETIGEQNYYTVASYPIIEVENPNKVKKQDISKLLTGLYNLVYMVYAKHKKDNILFIPKASTPKDGDFYIDNNILYMYDSSSVALNHQISLIPNLDSKITAATFNNLVGALRYFRNKAEYHGSLCYEGKTDIIPKVLSETTYKFMPDTMNAAYNAAKILLDFVTVEESTTNE